MRKEIGGYIEFEHFTGSMVHEDALALNCGRNALAYLIQVRKINKIKLPFFMCDSVINTCINRNVEICFYHIDTCFLPVDIELQEDEWLYLADFYGQLQKEVIQNICRKYRRVIVDYAQAYFEMPVEGIDSLYTCRKYFGVADGAFLYTDIKQGQELEQDESFDRMRFLMGRYERTASEFYWEYAENNKQFANEPIKKMSKLTYNLLHGIDYEAVKNIRTSNFAYLDRRIRGINLLKPNRAEGAFAYPLLVENGEELRKQLISQNIFVPTLWPNVVNDLPESMLEHQLAKNILPIPCDQRYNEEDMEYICNLIFESIA